MQSRDEQARAHEDEQRRRRINIAAGLFLAVLLGVAVWTVKLFNDQEKLQRCLDARRTDCFAIQEAPREGLRIPAR